MISDTMFTLAVCAAAFSLIFAIICAGENKRKLIHKLYFCTVALMLVWFVVVAGFRFISSPDGKSAYILDSLTYLANFTPPLFLLVSLVFITGREKLPKRSWMLFLIPLLINILVWTNPLHHLHYRVFSIERSGLVAGPFLFANAVYSYGCILTSAVLVMRFGIRSHNRLQMAQAVLFALGDIIPVTVSTIATLGVVKLSIAVTPLSYTATIVLHGLAIFQFHMLDLKPIAMQKVLDWISDCYLVISDQNLVVSYNLPFHDIIGKYYGIHENIYLQDCVKDDAVENKAVIKNLIAVIDTCKNGAPAANVSYEQAIPVREAAGVKMHSYMVEVTPLKIDDRTVGFAAIFKDVSRIKESMEKLQASQTRMMEQERLASLGHLIGGIAHNLKTPIMSISGGATALDGLIQESQESLGDPEITDNDYREIYGEMSDWTERIRTACSYMSDIITAVKGQAANVNSAEESEFRFSNLMEMVLLLLRHELLKGNCKLTVLNRTGQNIYIHGDINNMIQVVNNFVSNAIDAMQPDGGEIQVEALQREDCLNILVRDRGPGVPPEVRGKLFKQMITSKGANGTGLGVFISTTVIKAKFGGSVWLEDNPGGGSVFGISLPMEYISLRGAEGEKQNEEK